MLKLRFLFFSQTRLLILYIIFTWILPSLTQSLSVNTYNKS